MANVFRVLFNPADNTVPQILEVPAGSVTGTKLSQFDKPTLAEAEAECATRGLTLINTPGRRQLHLFTVAAAADPTTLAPFQVLVGPLTELNGRVQSTTTKSGKTISIPDYSAAKQALAAVVIDTTKPAQVALKAALLACYPA